MAKKSKDLSAAVEAAKSKPVVRNPIVAPPPPSPLQGNVAESLRASHALKTREIEDAVEPAPAFRFGFLGSGQGGGRLTNEFFRLGYRRAAVFNTTDSDFGDLDPKLGRFSLDVGGAAKDMEQAAKALKGREEGVRDLLSDRWGSNVDYGLITVSLGGGTGGGTLRRLIDITRGYLQDTSGHTRVGALVSLPTASEGYRVARNAVIAFREVLDAGVSPLFVIDNSRIVSLYNPSMLNLHQVANRSITQLIDLFLKLAAVKSEMMTFDAAELGQLLDSGLVVMGAANVASDGSEIKTPSMVSAAIRDELEKSVLAEVDIGTGDKGCCLFVGDEQTLNTLSLEYFEAGFGQLDRALGASRKQPADVVLHRGVYRGEAPGLQVYTMIGGLSMPANSLRALSEKGGLLSASNGAGGWVEWLKA